MMVFFLFLNLGHKFDEYVIVTNSVLLSNESKSKWCV